MITSVVPSKVLHIVPTDGVGGVPTVVANLIQSIPHVVHHVCGHRDHRADSVLSRVAISFVDVDLRRFSFRSARNVRRLVGTNGYDIVHCHGRGAALFGLLSRVFRRPAKGPALVYTFHGYNGSRFGRLSPLYRALERRIARTFHGRIALTASEFEAVAREIGDPLQNLKIVPNGIAAPDCRPTVTPRDAGLDRFRFVSAGRVSTQKDYLTLLRALAALDVAVLTQLSVHIFGTLRAASPDYIRTHWRLRRSLGLRGRVFFCGEVHNGAQSFCAFDAFISTSAWEGQPTAVIEAGLAGLPAVATRCQGNVDVVVEGRTGFLAEMEDARAVADAVTRLVSSNYRQLGENARKEYRTTYSFDVYAAGIEVAYREAIRAQRGPS